MNCTENDPVKFVKITVKLETTFSDVATVINSSILLLSYGKIVK